MGPTPVSEMVKQLTGRLHLIIQPLLRDLDDQIDKRLVGTFGGTLLYDLQSHRPVDLLLDRTTQTLSNLADRPSKHSPRDIPLVSRDRFEAYTDAITQALPGAIQVADRWYPTGVNIAGKTRSAVGVAGSVVNDGGSERASERAFEDSENPELCEGAETGYDAVIAALTYEWSHGLVEGAINRLKSITRALRGQANFDLLRARACN